MGNSQLDLIVFAEKGGFNASEKAKGKVKIGKLILEHINKYEKEVSKLKIKKNKIAPILLPDYIPEQIKNKQKTLEYYGNLL